MMKQTEETKPVEYRGSVWQRPLARTYNKDWAIEVELGDLLYGLVRALKPEVIVETGTFEGFSAVRMAQALKDNDKGVILTIDYKDYGAKKMFEEYEVADWVELIIGRSPAALEKLVSEKEVDLIFLDNGHEYDVLTSELNVLNKYLKKGAYITGHDYLSQTNTVGRAYDDFIKSHAGQYQSMTFYGGNGLIVLRKLTDAV